MNNFIDIFHKYSLEKGNYHALYRDDLKKLLEAECPQYMKVQRGRAGTAGARHPSPPAPPRPAPSTALRLPPTFTPCSFPSLSTEEGCGHLVQRAGRQQGQRRQLRGVPGAGGEGGHRGPRGHPQGPQPLAKTPWPGRAPGCPWRRIKELIPQAPLRSLALLSCREVPRGGGVDRRGEKPREETRPLLRLPHISPGPTTCLVSSLRSPQTTSDSPPALASVTGSRT